jgi:iron(III) transport system permease protein
MIMRDPVLAATIVFVAASLVLFILWPLYEVLWEGFINEKGDFTLQYYSAALAKTENIRTLANTIWLGIFVSAVSTFIGFLFAYADAFLKNPLQRIVQHAGHSADHFAPFLIIDVFHHAVRSTGLCHPNRSGA